MRRLILEVFEKELAKIGIEFPEFRPIKSLELLYFLRQDQNEFAAISQVEFKDPESDLDLKVETLLKGGFLVEAQILERQKNGACIMFMRGGPSLSSLLSAIGIESGYLFTPIGIGEGKIRFSFLGSEQQIKDFMEKVSVLGIRYRVVLLADASFSPTSPLNQLTEKQREVLLAAYKMGYYDIPRKITTEELARKLDLADSTVVEHLRKAERRLIRQLMEQ
ncbi:MAG: helix-turn-helix domain-containing protein [Candidatus Bathyarchaeota archaeon]|nr:helix-turn-helix domain-containing protein [Candidatus Bathyarchaeota archaeon]